MYTPDNWVILKALAVIRALRNHDLLDMEKFQ